MRIAPDIDAMMWDIANTRDVTAAENFAKMFPDLGSELSKRMLLVQDIRRAKDLHLKPVAIPAFRPSGSASKRVVPKRAAVGALLVGAAALAFGAYAWIRQNPAPAAPVAQACPDRRGPAHPLANDGLRHTESSVPNSLEPAVPFSEGFQAHHPLRNDGSSKSVQAPARSSQTAAKPLRIRLDGVQLSAALQAVADQGGLTLEPAPNMPNPTVSLSYDQMDAMSVLKDMGSKYGFDALPDGDGKVLLIPKASVANSQN